MVTGVKKESSKTKVQRKVYSVLGEEVKVGYLERDVDISGVSGTGSVAEFAVSSKGNTVIFWEVGTSQFPSLEDAIKTHGHNGSTRFVILNDEVEDVPHCYECHEDPKYPRCPKHDFGCPSCLSQVG